MAHDEARAERIRHLKEQRPDLTWRRIADAVGVGERSALYWQQTGGIGYETSRKLADVFGADPDWLWSGRTSGETPDLMGALSEGRTDLDRLEASVEALHAKVDALLDAVGAKPPAGGLAEQMRRMTEQVEAALSPLAPPDAESASPADQSRRKRRPPAKKD